jgi:hypothetical protein
MSSKILESFVATGLVAILSLSSATLAGAFILKGYTSATAASYQDLVDAIQSVLNGLPEGGWTVVDLHRLPAGLLLTYNGGLVQISGPGGNLSEYIGGPPGSFGIGGPGAYMFRITSGIVEVVQVG